MTVYGQGSPGTTDERSLAARHRMLRAPEDAKLRSRCCAQHAEDVRVATAVLELLPRQLLIAPVQRIAERARCVRDMMVASHQSLSRAVLLEERTRAATAAADGAADAACLVGCLELVHRWHRRLVGASSEEHPVKKSPCCHALATVQEEECNTLQT